MKIDLRYEAPVREAFDNYVGKRKLPESIAILSEAVNSGRIDLGLFDEAKAAFGELLKELAESEDGVVENQWEIISSKSLIDLIGIEHTEKSMAPAKSGAVEVSADATVN